MKAWDPKEHHGRCMEHSMHCTTRAVIETVAPTPIHLIKKKLAMATNLDDTTLDDEDDDWAAEGEPEDDDDDCNDVNFDPKDILGKILAFVNQVRSSPQARTYFKRLCEEEKVRVLQLLKWVRTRWASLYDLICCLLDVRPACNKFTLLADESPLVPKLRDGKSYGMFRLSAGEWLMLGLMQDVLHVSHGRRPHSRCLINVSNRNL